MSKLNKFFIMCISQIIFIGLTIIDLKSIFCQLYLITYLTLAPGYFLIKIFSLDNLNYNKKIAYSVGLSLVFLIFNGFMLMGLPLLGILKPFSKRCIKTVIIVTTMLLYAITTYKYIKYENLNLDTFQNKYNLKIVMTTMLICYLAFFGVYLLNYYSTNIIILALIILISLLPPIAILSDIKHNVYPYLIVSSLFILLSFNILFSKYMIVTDNMYEIYFIKLSENSGFWVNLPSTLNTMFGIIAIPVILSKITGLNIVYLYRILSLISIVIPISLYETYNKLWDSKIAFLASFLFVNMFSFFTWCAVTLKMLFSGVFLALILLTTVLEDINKYKRILLIYMFTFSLLISHYGTAYIFMITLIVGYFVVFILKKEVKSSNLVNFNFIAAYITMTLAWYIFINGSSTYDVIVGYTNHILSNIYNTVVPTSTLTLMSGKISMTVYILKVLYSILVVVTIIGILSELIEKNKTQKKIDGFHILSFTIILFILLNYLFTSGGYIGRIWYISYIFLSPYFVIGSIRLTNLLVYLLKYVIDKKEFTDILANKKFNYSLVLIYLVVFVLFNSGFASAVFFKDYGPGIYLSKDRILKSNNTVQEEYFYRRYVVNCNIFSAKWLSQYRNIKSRIYCDSRGFQSLCSFGEVPPSGQIQATAEKYHILKIFTKNIELKRHSYLYLRHFNIIKNSFVINQYPLILCQINSILKPKLNINTKINKIYTNNCSAIYYIN